MTLTLSGLVLLVLIAAVFTVAGQALIGGAPGGLMLTTALGVLGAIVGPWVAMRLGLSDPFVMRLGGRSIPVLWSVVGAALFVAIVFVVSR